ncbi:probable serine/threonine-protein kinase clkA [Achroia grisella]|uniref:probable serine/threonine-protein kinase clkA n=1 Tax=Achroia grisella TaxID=688607 RepID=UPI0027D2F357|nr:probable serine/threonine-protein kinase clkA [Achroia grisella]
MEVVDEDLTDPITLFGYEQPAEYRTELIKIDENKQTIESEHKDKEELKYVSSYRRKSFVPVSFFDIANNIRLLTICCPLSIKVIDCVKFPLHFKRRMDRVLDMNDRLKNTNDCLKNQSVKSKNNMNRLIGLRIIRTNIVIDIGSEDEYDDIEYIEIEKESSKRNAYLDDVDSAFQSVGTDLTSINNISNATVIEPRNINENELQEKETNNKNSRNDKNTGNQDKGIAKRMDLLCSKPDNSVSSLETHKNRAPSHHKQVGLNTNTKTLYENGDNNISEKNSSLHEFKATLENNSNTNKTFDNTNEIHLDNDSNHLYVTKNVKKTNVNEINRETDTGNKVPQNKITTDGVKKDIKFPFLEFESDSTFLLLQSGSNNAPHTKHGSSNVCTKTTYIKNESKDICGNDKKSHNSKKKTRPDIGKVKSSSHRYRVEEKKTNIKILPVAHPYTLHKKKITNMTSNSKFKEAIDARNRAVKKNLPDAEKINKGKTIDDLPQQLSTPVRSSPSPLNPLQSSNSRNSSQWAVPQQIQTQQSLPGSAPPLYSFLPTTSLRPPETRLSPPSSIFQKPSHLPQQQGNSKQHQETRKNKSRTNSKEEKQNSYNDSKQDSGV